MSSIISNKIFNSYFNKKVIYIMDFLTDEEVEVLKQLKINIEDKQYSYNEFDKIYDELSKFKLDRIPDEYFWKPDEKLPTTVNRKRYNELMKKLRKIVGNIKVIEI